MKPGSLHRLPLATRQSGRKLLQVQRGAISRVTMSGDGKYFSTTKKGALPFDAGTQVLYQISLCDRSCRL